MVRFLHGSWVARGLRRLFRAHFGHQTDLGSILKPAVRNKRQFELASDQKPIEHESRGAEGGGIAAGSRSTCLGKRAITASNWDRVVVETFDQASGQRARNSASEYDGFRVED